MRQARHLPQAPEKLSDCDIYYLTQYFFLNKIHVQKCHAEPVIELLNKDRTEMRVRQVRGDMQMFSWSLPLQNEVSVVLTLIY